MNYDLRFYDSAIRGYLKRREIGINDSLGIGHVIATKVVQGFHKDFRGFNKPIEPVRLVEPSKAERQQKRQAELDFILKGGYMDGR